MSVAPLELAHRIDESDETVSSSPLTVAKIEAACARLREASRKSIPPSQIADTIARAVALWRDRNCPRSVEATARIARNAGFSTPLMRESIDALLRPFTPDALAELASRVTPRDSTNRAQLLGFIMAGNVAGAGLHEVVIALLAGATVLIKTASSEPIFFAEFARTVDEIDCDLASRISVFNWRRDRADLTAALTANCDAIVAYGDDATLESLTARALFGFGSRVSGAVIAASAIASAELDTTVDLLARDVAYFEQLGCLSPHHIFVVTREVEVASNFTNRISAALDRLSKLMPPAKIPLSDAAKIVSIRENARWGRIAGDAIILHEGPRLEWTVVFDPDASFCVSPGFRTVVVSAVRDWSDLTTRLTPVKGLIEACAFSGNESEAALFRTMAIALGIAYVARCGAMQSPPLDWQHGGGAFLTAMLAPR